MRLRAVPASPIFLCGLIAVLGAPVALAAPKPKPKATAPTPPPEPEPAPEPAPEPEPVPEPATAPKPAPAAAAAAAPQASKEHGNLMFLEAGFRWDLGTFTQRANVGANETNNSDQIRAFDPMFHVGYLSTIDKTWRIGGAFGYGGNYDLNNDNLLLGQLLTVDLRVEARTQVAEKVWLFAQPKVGVSAIIPGGILQDRITANQNFGFDTWSGPRWGFLVGADAGARYYLNDWFSLRASVGYAWTMNFLIDSSASNGDISASQTWRTQSSRVSGNIGLEASF